MWRTRPASAARRAPPAKTRAGCCACISSTRSSWCASAARPIPPRSTRSSPLTPRRCCSGSSRPTVWPCCRPTTTGSRRGSRTTSRHGRPASDSGSRCRARARTRTIRRAAPTSAAGPSPARSRSSCTRSTRRASHCRAPSPPCWRRTSSPTDRSRCRRRSRRTSAPTGLADVPGALRRAGPTALVAVALLFGALSLGYAWIVAKHMRDDARETSRLLGHVFAGLNDPRDGAAADALLALAEEVRRLGIPIAVTDTAGRITALDNAPFPATADDATRRAWLAHLDEIHEPLVHPGVGTIHYGALPAARAFPGLPVLQGP